VKKIESKEFENAKKILENQAKMHAFLQKSKVINPYQMMYLDVPVWFQQQIKETKPTFEKHCAHFQNEIGDLSKVPLIQYTDINKPIQQKEKNLDETTKKIIQEDEERKRADAKQYQEHIFLVSLIQMGFTNAEENLKIMKETKGNLTAAVELLLKK